MVRLAKVFREALLHSKLLPQSNTMSCVLFTALVLASPHVTSFPRIPSLIFNFPLQTGIQMLIGNSNVLLLYYSTVLEQKVHATKEVSLEVNTGNSSR